MNSSFSFKDVDKFVSNLEDRLRHVYEEVHTKECEIQDLANGLRLHFSIDVIRQLNTYLNLLKEESIKLKGEISQIKGIRKEMDSEFLSIPHQIVNEEYLDYYLYVDQKIKTIIFGETTYIIPIEKQNYRVWGKIIVTVRRDGENTVVRYQADTHNYIHGNDQGTSLCTGNLNLDYLTEAKINQLKEQFSIANLNSANNNAYPYRQLNLLVRELINEGGHDGKQRTWKV